MNVSNHNAGRGVLRGSEAWISNTIDWEYSSNLSLMSISSYVVRSTKETGNTHMLNFLGHAAYFCSTRMASCMHLKK